MDAAARRFFLGANPDPEGKGTRFTVWAPKSDTVKLHIVSGPAAGAYPMEKEVRGYFSATLPGVGDGARYLYQPGAGELRPDPASRYQPDGVHQASQVVDPRLFSWEEEGWSGIALEQYIVYELHVGTFTHEGTFEAVIPQLDYLLELGITAVEIMPVAQFAGDRGWGYDGVGLYAPHNSYGGPGGLKQLVNACHRKGLAVILDVVYNHLGPEGNHLADFGPYFTEKYHTPWGRAINVDNACSDEVRSFFIGNARYWIEEYHLDALRLDAVDWILDQRAQHFLLQLSTEVRALGQRLGRPVYLFAENDTNDVRLINPPAAGGYGIDVQWCDNFHHAVRALITGETTGYYEDFGQFSQLVKAFTDGFVYTGQYSRYRQRCHGAPVGERLTTQFLVFSQNHDQVGNRKCGDRLSAEQPLEKLLLVAGTVILSPYLPLLFMGEEYGEKAPFHYFVGYTDPELIAAVRKGKQEEHASGICEGEIPDPEAEATFLESKVNPELRKEGDHALIYQFYRELISLRKQLPALQVADRQRIEVTVIAEQRVLLLRRQSADNQALCIFSYSNTRQTLHLGLPPGNWEKLLDSSAQRWRGPGEEAPSSIQVTDGDIMNEVTINPFSLLVYAGSR